jgi:hypothetical protein
VALIVKDMLIRKRDGALPAGSSGFFVMKKGRVDLKQHFFFFTKRKPVLKEKLRECFYRS